MPGRILIIEDDETCLGLMAYLFGAFGYEPALARDGAEGLQAARRLRPDLIICDLDLPEVDGFEVARRLDQDRALAGVPLVAVTALAMVGDREKALRAGFDGYIPKPIVPEEFVSQMETFLAPEQRSGRAPSAPLPAIPSRDRAVAAPGKSPESPGQTAPPHQGRGTVLILDDSPMNLALMRSILEPSGYETITTDDPQEALGLAGKRPPDVIVSDVHMPAQSGYEFARRLKEHPRLERIPLVLMTSSKSPRMLVPSWASGLRGVKVIPRPCDPETLLAEIQSCLQGTGGYGDHTGD